MKWAVIAALRGVARHSHLAVVSDMNEILAITTLSNEDPWVGLTRRGTPMTFRWITPDNDGDCGRLLSTGLADSPCAEARAAVGECDEVFVDADRL